MKTAVDAPLLGHLHTLYARYNSTNTESLTLKSPATNKTSAALLLRYASGSAQQTPQALQTDPGWVLGMAYAAACLCENPQTGDPQQNIACGNCPSCHLLQAGNHPDLGLLLPETHSLALGQGLSPHAQKELDEKKRKPSSEIRIDAMHEMLASTQLSAGRSKGKVVLITPAHSMNTVTANALLKTLEEPPPGLRFVLISSAPQQLLATIRSRCLSYNIPSPRPATRSDAQWQRIPALLSAGQAQAFQDMAPKMAVQTCLQLCHDMLMQHLGCRTAYFAQADLQSLKKSPPEALLQWHKTLINSMKTAEHPYRETLFLEHLATQAARALRG